MMSGALDKVARGLHWPRTFIGVLPIRPIQILLLEPRRVRTERVVIFFHVFRACSKFVHFEHTQIRKTGFSLFVYKKENFQCFQHWNCGYLSLSPCVNSA